MRSGIILAAPILESIWYLEAMSNIWELTYLLEKS
jgi:hypothetical protein